MSLGRGPLGWRVALTLLLLGYMVLALASGLDRLSQGNAALARLVPAPFRAEANRTLAGDALLRGDRTVAMAASRKALHADPADPTGGALLGAAYMLQGNASRADAAFRVAAQFGWRVQLTQFYWYDAALRAGDLQQAALRADALLRANPKMPEGTALIAGLEASPAGRAALAQRLTLGPGWTERYFSVDDGTDRAALAYKQAVALQVAKLGTRVDCETLFGLIERLRQSGSYQGAREVWRAHCGDPGPSAGVADGRFEQLSRNSKKDTPLGWRFIRSGEMQANVVPLGKGAYGVQANNMSDIGLPVLAQPVEWPAGHYRLQIDTRAQDASAAGRIFASLNCGEYPQRPPHLEGDPATKGQILEAQSCPDQILALWLRPGNDTVNIANVRVEKTD